MSRQLWVYTNTADTLHTSLRGQLLKVCQTSRIPLKLPLQDATLVELKSESPRISSAVLSIAHGDRLFLYCPAAVGGICTITDVTGTDIVVTIDDVFE